MKKISSASGFTLIELLVVVSIIGMLASIVLAALSGARGKAVIAASQSFDDNVYHVLGVNAVAQWGFDDGSGSTVADASINGNTLTISGTGYSWVPGVFGGALQLNGNQTLSETFSGSAYKGFDQMGNAFTASFWMNTSNNTTRQNILEVVPYASQNFALNVDGNSAVQNAYNGRMDVEIVFSGCFMLTADTNLSANTWYNITYTKNGSADAGTVYLNGNKIPSGSTTTGGCGTTFSFAGVTGFNVSGAGFGNQVVGFNGILDNIRLYSQALADSQVREIYADGALSHNLAIR